MKLGEVIYAKTHADFLNQLLGTKHKAWMKSSVMLPDGKRLWMIELGNHVTPAGWINQLVGRDKISERHLGGGYAFDSHNTYYGAREDGVSWGPETRVIFDIIKGSLGRKYIFRGVFRIDRDKSSVTENVWKLIAEEYIF